ncbi:uncharacterized protein KY384_000633 [Bacidia gigantensis]|uniref:uncharacterized protein n=1 Tax=Bacidia gigantensis TaxID=2732470 RepID=UPI001D04FDEB|nr:uncharacterized protein KY384_000633 [Bacidia gigantensis]KAG8525873.1 hypothetical protein KY384_000633 [Bacidia gigantensis]
MTNSILYSLVRLHDNLIDTLKAPCIRTLFQILPTILRHMPQNNVRRDRSKHPTLTSVLRRTDSPPQNISTAEAPTLLKHCPHLPLRTLLQVRCHLTVLHAWCADAHAVTEGADMMAAAQMQPRPYHMYTPQSNSPASAVSSHGQEQPNRLYSHPAHMQPGIYYSNYPMSHIPTQPPHQMMTPPQSAVPHHPNQPPVTHPQPPGHIPTTTGSPRPQSKFDPGLQQRPMDTNALQKSPTGPLTSSLNTPKTSSQNGGTGSPGHHAANSSAAPGPIPATTPLVVRQDNNGVQWIAFEYSKDRVKMEYTIRCDVESVNVDELSKEFKENNCVYPRAFCDKEQYTGNRLTYETECNTVGWSLVKLNSHLKEKRGLIQRAVDSWRNSNQDSRLRSRRVRRMNKQNIRSKNQQANQGANPSGVSNAMLQQRPLPPTMNPAVSTQMHHHHANVEGAMASGADALTMDGHYEPHHPPSKSHPSDPSAQIRPANVFHGYPSYPLQPNSNAVSVPPQLQHNMEPHLASHPATTIPASISIAPSMPPTSSTRSNDSPSDISSKAVSELYTNVPGKKFINVHDYGHSPNKVRVKLDLREARMDEVVDDFRERNSVCPRSYFPHQMPLTQQEKRQKRLDARFADDDNEDIDGLGFGRTTVKIPTLDGEVDAPVPRLGKHIGEQEEMLNDLGYRISWDQCQKYDKRVIFLQRSRKSWNGNLPVTETLMPVSTVDAWRKKIVEHNSHPGQEVSTIPPFLHLRNERKTWPSPTTDATSTSR